MIDNFARGGAAINVLTRRFGAELVVVNVGSKAKKLPPSVIDLRVRPGTANWLPARLTVGPMLLAFRILGLDPRRAWRILRRDGRKHPSPNSGIPESLMSGGLGIRLGGTNTYDGVPSRRPHFGVPVLPKRREHIREALCVLHWTTLLYVAMLGFVCPVASGLDSSPRMIDGPDLSADPPPITGK
ncbi:hypothetical protein PLACP1_05010 [Planifilum fimeticola]